MPKFGDLQDINLSQFTVGELGVQAWNRDMNGT